VNMYLMLTRQKLANNRRWYYSTFGAYTKRRLADLFTFHSRIFTWIKPRHNNILLTVQSSQIGRDKYLIDFKFLFNCNFS
jgi:hypothetical protein